jgi:hypothetical protein
LSELAKDPNAVGRPFDAGIHHLFDARPSVNIIHEAFRPIFFATTLDSAYAFLCYLQILTLLGFAFATRAIFGATIAASFLSSAALCVGFFGQYVFDINAWSQLAATPILIITFAILTLTYGGYVRGALQHARVAAPLAASLSAVAFIYPEMLVLILGITGAIALAALIFSRSAWLPATATVGAAAIAALLTCVPIWTNTISFLYRQLTFAPTAPIGWFYYFDAYLFGSDGTSIKIVEGQLADGDTWLSVAAKVFVGAIGLYSALPPTSVQGKLAILWWSVIIVAIFLVLASSLVAASKVVSGDNRGAKLALCGAMAAAAVPLPLIISGSLWSAGKALSYAWPFVFLLVVLPLVVREARIPWRVAAALFVGIHISLGIVRVPEAASPDGIHQHYPYPSDPAIKAASSWDLPRWRKRLEECSLVLVRIADERVDRYAQVYLTNLDVPWRSTNPVGIYFSEILLDSTAQSLEPDCEITDAQDHDANAIYIGAAR